MSKKLYFIAILPPEGLRDLVRAQKEVIKARYGAAHALKSPAHITLQMPFHLEDGQVDTLEQTLAGFAMGQKPFPVQLNGYDAFPPRVLFIRVVDHRPFLPLRKALKSALVDSGILSPEKQPRPFHPHMTLATRDLTEHAFEQAWPVYEKKDFEASFEADAIALLRHNGRFWDVLREFEFQDSHKDR